MSAYRNILNCLVGVIIATRRPFPGQRSPGSLRASLDLKKTIWP